VAALLVTGFLAAGLAASPKASTAAAAGPAGPVTRVEARSADFLAVGVARGGSMSIHISHLLDNAPVRDAVVNVGLRGTDHATKAEADGSYTLESGDLELPGAAAIDFRVAENGTQEVLKGTLSIAGAARPQESSSGRQLWWWALNFGVCIGFLYLYSRRRKASQD
jgi:hypothetical protein